MTDKGIPVHVVNLIINKNKTHILRYLNMEFEKSGLYGRHKDLVPLNVMKD